MEIPNPREKGRFGGGITIHNMQLQIDLKAHELYHYSHLLDKTATQYPLKIS